MLDNKPAENLVARYKLDDANMASVKENLKTWISCDLGTNKSCACYVDFESKKDIIPVLGNNNAAAIPSKIGVSIFMEEKDDGNEVPRPSFYIGESANKLGSNGLFSSLKRIAFSSANDKATEVLTKSLGFKVDTHDGKLCGICKKSGREIPIPVEDMVRELLKYIKDRSSNLLSSTHNVENIVLTVPVEYEPHRREKLKQLAYDIGFKQVELIAEPLAALLGHYGIENGNWIVFDMGGGTFDTCAVSLTQDSVEVLAYDGLIGCGGDDIDGAIAVYLFNKIKGTRIRVPTGIIPKTSTDIYRQFIAICEQIKMTLSDVNINCWKDDAWLDKQTGYEFPDVTGPKDSFYTPREIMKATSSIVEKCKSRFLKCFDKCKRSKNITPDKVLIVGAGSQFMPMRMMLEELAEKKGLKLYYSNEPTVSIARGALVKKIYDECQNNLGKSAENVTINNNQSAYEDVDGSSQQQQEDAETVAPAEDELFVREDEPVQNTSAVESAQVAQNAKVDESVQNEQVCAPMETEDERDALLTVNLLADEPKVQAPNSEASAPVATPSNNDKMDVEMGDDNAPAQSAPVATTQAIQQSPVSLDNKKSPSENVDEDSSSSDDDSDDSDEDDSSSSEDDQYSQDEEEPSQSTKKKIAPEAPAKRLPAASAAMFPPRLTAALAAGKNKAATSSVPRATTVVANAKPPAKTTTNLVNNVGSSSSPSAPVRRIIDICPYEIVIPTCDGGVDVVIPSGARLPADRTRQYITQHKDQGSVIVKVYTSKRIDKDSSLDQELLDLFAKKDNETDDNDKPDVFIKKEWSSRNRAYEYNEYKFVKQIRFEGLAGGGEIKYRKEIPISLEATVDTNGCVALKFTEKMPNHLRNKTSRGKTVMPVTHTEEISAEDLYQSRFKHRTQETTKKTASPKSANKKRPARRDEDDEDSSGEEDVRPKRKRQRNYL